MFGYVILHYQNIEITINCVEHIINRFPHSHVVIVDNFSPNKSGEQLKERYRTSEMIQVVLNNQNDGFAKGNNIGFEYIKSKYDLDYLVVMNNDIIIDDFEFENKIKSFMNEYQVDVCGPDIVTLNKNHQNPLVLSPFSNSFLKKRIFVDTIKTYFLKSDLVFNWYSQYKEKNRPKPRSKPNKAFNCILHGSCVVYSKKYISRENFAFLPITFMYNEEAILYDYLEYRGYQTGYCDETTITHLEGAATSTSIKDTKEKVLFRFKHNTESLKKQLLEREKYK